MAWAVSFSLLFFCYVHNPEKQLMGAGERLVIIADRFLQPIATRLQGAAEADNAWRMAHVKEAAADLAHRGRIRREADDARHQQNLEAIARKSLAQVPDMEQKLLPPPSEGAGNQPEKEHPEPDWFSKFTNFARETSDGDLQALWAKVLAGEVVQPGTFSLRLLQQISLMRKADAVTFEKFANYVWQGQPPCMFQFTNAEVDKFLIEARGMTEDFYSSLHNWGLIDDSGLHVLDLPQFKTYLRYGRTEYCIERRTPSPVDFFVRVRRLTPLGRELYMLCDPDVDEVYVRCLKNSLGAQDLVMSGYGATRPDSALNALSKLTRPAESIWL